MSKRRIDLLLVERGLAESRQRAQALIMAGAVLVGEQPVDKPGIQVPVEAEVRLKGNPLPYVSRGGLKLASALDHFDLPVAGLRILDAGISTGGFTDCLLQRGAARVYGVDVGRGQVAWKLRQDERVELFEEVNLRHFDPALLGSPVDLVVADLSFISLTLVLPVLVRAVVPGGLLLPMVKPQFEVGRGEVGRKGVVRDEAARLGAVARVVRAAEELGLELLGQIPSGLPGPEGNIEYFVLLRAPGG